MMENFDFSPQTLYTVFAQFCAMSGSKKADLSEMNILAMVLIVAAILVVVLVLKGILTRS